MFFPKSFVELLKACLIILVLFVGILCFLQIGRRRNSTKPKHMLNTGRKVPCFHVRKDCEECISQNFCNQQEENLLQEEEDNL